MIFLRRCKAVVAWNVSGENPKDRSMTNRSKHSAIGKLAALLAALFLFAGQAVAAKHNPVIFLHGWRSDDTIWSDMINLMVNAGWSITNLHALSYWEDGRKTVPFYAEKVGKEVDALLDKKKGANFDFVVHSMGGLVLRQMLIDKPSRRDRIGRVVDLATPHFGQFRDEGEAAEDMKYGSEFLWNLNWAWHANSKVRIKNLLCIAGVSHGNTGSGRYDGLVNQWSAALGLEWAKEVLFVNKSHGMFFPGTSIYDCPNNEDPVWRATKQYLEEGTVLSQSECGASVPSEGGAIFLQVVDSNGNPISWPGRMIASVKKSSGEDVDFYEHHGEMWHTIGNVFSGGGTSMQKGIALLTTQTDASSTFKGFDRGFYDIEFLAPANSNAGFTYRGVEVLWNRTTLLRITPPTRLMVGICIDCSGSMSNYGRIENAIASAQRTIDTLPAGTIVEIMRFESSPKLVQPFVEIKDNSNGTSNRRDIKELIGTLFASGGTDILAAGNKMLSHILSADSGKTAVRSMILLTDGEDDNFKNNKDSFIQACNEAGVSFNAIAYGKAADAKTLADVAKGTRGSHFESGDSAADLDQAFERTVADILNKAEILDWEGTFSALPNPTTTGQGVLASKTFKVDSSAKPIHIVSSVAKGYTVTLRNQTTGEPCTGTVREDGTGSTYTFDVENPTSGTWSLDFVKTSTASADGRISIMVTTPAAAAESAPSLSLAVYSGENAIRATLKKGGLVRGARVSARCRVDGQYRDVSMTEEAPGVYYLDLLACGDFQEGLVVSAEATAGTATIVATDATGAAITPLRVSSLTESFSRARFLNMSKVGDGAIRRVSVLPRWPWEGKVDIDFEAAVIDKNTVLSIGLSGVDAESSDTYVVQSLTSDETLARVSPGKHRITWNAAKDVPNADIENFSIRFNVTTAKALANVTGVSASAGTYLDGVHVSWNAVSYATHYRVYRSDSSSSTSAKSLLTTTTGRSYVDSSAVADKKYYYYWIRPIARTSAGTVKFEGELSVSGGGWKKSLGAVSGLSASSGTHYDGVHLSWTGPAGATKYKIYRSTSSSVSTKSLLATTTSQSYVDTSAVKLKKYYYYWVEPIAEISSVSYVGKLNSSAVSGWRNKLGTPSFHFENWRPGHKDRPHIDLVIDGSVSGATRYDYMSGDHSGRWKSMDAVVNGTGSYDIFSISASASPRKATIGWAFAYRYQERVYVRAANSEGVGDWVKWNLADHLNESAFKNSAFYKAYPKK